MNYPKFISLMNATPLTGFLDRTKSYLCNEIRSDIYKPWYVTTSRLVYLVMQPLANKEAIWVLWICPITLMRGMFGIFTRDGLAGSLIRYSAFVQIAKSVFFICLFVIRKNKKPECYLNYKINVIE